MPSYEDLPPMERVKACEAARERLVEQMLGRTEYGECRPPYRNMATGKLSFPILSPLEVEAKRKARGQSS